MIRYYVEDISKTKKFFKLGILKKNSKFNDFFHKNLLDNLKTSDICVYLFVYCKELSIFQNILVNLSLAIIIQKPITKLQKALWKINNISIYEHDN